MEAEHDPSVVAEQSDQHSSIAPHTKEGIIEDHADQSGSSTQPGTFPEDDVPETPERESRRSGLDGPKEDGGEDPSAASGSGSGIQGDENSENAKDSTPKTQQEVPMREVSLKEVFEVLFTKIEMLEDEVSKTKGNAKGVGQSDVLELSTDIKRLAIDQWRPGTEFFKRPDISQSNVLVVYSRQVPRGPTIESATGDVGDSGDSSMSERVERVQINSKPLLKELSYITGLSFSKTSCVMVPPFKVLVGERDKIKAHLDMKQKELRDSQGKGPTARPQTPGETKREEDTKSRKQLVEHLTCLIDFIDKDLKSTMDLRRQIQEGTLEKISFENLWHLFEPGDLVFSAITSGRETDDYSYPRAFRFYKFTGGRPNLNARSDQATNPAQKLSSASGTEDESRRVEDEAMNAMGIAVNPVFLDLHYVDFNGLRLGPQTIGKSIIRYFDGEKKITDLSFYPAKFDPDSELKFEKLEERGERFLSLLERPVHQLHNGLTIGKDAEHVMGEVQIDFRTGYSMAPEEKIKSLGIGKLFCSSGQLREVWEAGADAGTSSKTSGLSMENSNNFDDHMYDSKRTNQFINDNLMHPVHVDDLVGELLRKPKMRTIYCRLAPREVLGYYFRTREWHLFNIENLQDIDPNRSKKDSPFDELVIDEDHKRRVLALVESHQSGTKKYNGKSMPTEANSVASSMDLIKGKGKGLVILLHGVPGVGKTSTAESVAEYTGRPLYPITCGDIGQTAEAVEKNLERHFKLAHKWGCVLLLDEADVFLAERSQHGDIARNALVSVFLRTLEYYSGILFLTTNRVGTLDEAFRSRIHVQLYYPNLTLESTRKIFQNSLRRIERENEENKKQPGYVEISFKEAAILRFAETHFDRNLPDKIWNGRQIRNAFQTALALALYERKTEIKDAARKQGKEPSEIEKGKQFRSAKLMKRHFEDVDQATQQYFEYLKKVNLGLSPEEKAAHAQLRAMDVEPQQRSTTSRARITRANDRAPGSSKAGSRKRSTAYRETNVRSVTSKRMDLEEPSEDEDELDVDDEESDEEGYQEHSETDDE